MYQFSEQFAAMNLFNKKRNYRWLGFLIGLFFGWLPAWGLQKVMQQNRWMFFLFWMGMIVLAYGIGRLVKKDRLKKDS